MGNCLFLKKNVKVASYINKTNEHKGVKAH